MENSSFKPRLCKNATTHSFDLVKQCNTLKVCMRFSASLFPEIEGGFYTVKFDSLLLKEAVLEADGIIPPLRQDDSSSSSSSDSEDDQCDAGYAKGAKAQQHHSLGWTFYTGMHIV